MSTATAATGASSVASMTTQQFVLVWALVLATMLVCRVVPIFVLKNRPIPQGFQHALGLIPPAAFAALVANDLFSPHMFADGVWAGLMPLIAAAVVIVVARKTGSLIWCAVVGVAAYFLLTLVPVQGF